MNQIKLIEKIIDIAKQAGIEIDKLDVSLTVTEAMNTKQRKDLASMIEHLEKAPNCTPSQILFNVIHDLRGLKAVYFEQPEGICFSPRSTGYSKK